MVESGMMELLGKFRNQLKILERDIEKQEAAFQRKRGCKSNIRKSPSLPTLLSVTVAL